MNINKKALRYSLIANLILIAINFSWINLSKSYFVGCPMIDLSFAEDLFMEERREAPVTKRDFQRASAPKLKPKALISNSDRREIELPQGAIKEEEEIGGREPENRMNFREDKAWDLASKSIVSEQGLAKGTVEAPSGLGVTSGEGQAHRVPNSNQASLKGVSEEGTEVKMASLVTYQKTYESQNWKIIRDLVAKHVEYPSVAVMRGWEGRVLIKLCIEKTRLCGSEIKESSGYTSLDESALRAVKKIDGLLPYAEFKVYIVLPVKFELRR